MLTEVSQHLRQLIGRHFQGPGGIGCSGNRLGKGRGARGVEGDVAFDLLHDLMDMAVEHRDRAERMRAPAPAASAVPQPQGHRSSTAEYARRPRSACRGARRRDRLPARRVAPPERAQRARLEIQHVVQADEMHAAVIEAVPAVALRALAEALEVGRAVVVGMSCSPGTCATSAREPLSTCAPYRTLGFRQMAHVAGVNEKAGVRHALILAIARLQGAGDVGVGGLVEADMGVADLHEKRFQTGLHACGSVIQRKGNGNAAGRAKTVPAPLQAMQARALRRVWDWVMLSS